jgi:hypothetical protein
VAIGFSSGPYPATRYLTAEKPALILAASPGVGSSSNQRGSGALVSIPDAERLADVVSERSTGKDSSMQGESHWQRVTKAGLTILP